MVATRVELFDIPTQTGLLGINGMVMMEFTLKTVDIKSKFRHHQPHTGQRYIVNSLPQGRFVCSLKNN